MSPGPSPVSKTSRTPLESNPSGLSPRSAAATAAPTARATSSPMPAATGARNGRAGMRAVSKSCGTAAGSLLPTAACSPSACAPTLFHNAPVWSHGSSCQAAPAVSDKPSRTRSAMRFACSAKAHAIIFSGRKRSRRSRSSFSPVILKPICCPPSHWQAFSIRSELHASGKEALQEQPVRSPAWAMVATRAESLRKPVVTRREDRSRGNSSGSGPKTLLPRLKPPS